jgi:type VI secretion system protein ImpD
MTWEPAAERVDGPGGGSPPVAALPAGRDLLDAGAGREQRDRAFAAMRAFVAEKRPAHALALWFGGRERDGFPDTVPKLRSAVARDVARIDELVSEQLDAVLHHPRFQRLEASWRGLRSLVETATQFEEREAPPVSVLVLTLSWADLARDLERAIDFDQSQIFRRVYEDGFGGAGGLPMGLVLCDFEVSHRPRPGVTATDVETLRRLATIAAASFAPFVIGAQPALLGVDRFADLEQPLDLSRTFEPAAWADWNALRKSEDARFVAVTAPRVLARAPWEDDGSRADGFRYREDVSAPDGSAWLWGTAVYALGSVVIRSFGETHWPSDVRGLPDAHRAGGLVEGLPEADLTTDAPGVVPRFATDLLVTDRLEKDLSDLGILPLCGLRGSRWAAFYCTPSIQSARTYAKSAATANARLSSMLHYMLAVSRFAHFVKIIGREKIGSSLSAAETQVFLHEWLMDYTTGDPGASPEMRARRPLRDAQVEVKEQPGRPGAYYCVFRLRPHYQVDEVDAAVRLVTEIAVPRQG